MQSFTGSLGLSASESGIKDIRPPFEKPRTGVLEAKDSRAVSQKVSRNLDGIKRRSFSL